MKKVAMNSFELFATSVRGMFSRLFLRRNEERSGLRDE